MRKITITRNQIISDNPSNIYKIAMNADTNFGGKILDMFRLKFAVQRDSDEVSKQVM